MVGPRVSGLGLAGKMGKVGGVAVSGSRAASRGPCADPSGPPAAPQNPTCGAATQMRGPGALEDSPPTLAQARGLHAHTWGDLLTFFGLQNFRPFSTLTLQASAQPVPLLTPSPGSPPPTTHPSTSPPPCRARGTGLYLSCLCLFFSSSIWEFRAEIRSLHSCSTVCFLGRGEAALRHISPSVSPGQDWGFRLVLGSVLAFRIEVLL